MFATRFVYQYVERPSLKRLKLYLFIEQSTNPHVQIHTYCEYRSTGEKSSELEVILEADEYLSPLLQRALAIALKPNSFKIFQDVPTVLPTNRQVVQILPYEKIVFPHIMENSMTSLANAYVIRKALIRKHHLWQTVVTWWTKHPGDFALKGHVPLTVNFELDYAEFLDEALQECWELTRSFAEEEKQWWILKPSMSDQGQGVRLFSSEEELRVIFEEWEENDQEEDLISEEENTPFTTNSTLRMGAGTMTSQLRHFVAQRYIDRPLLFGEYDRRKFHIRSYVLAVGALRVYLYRDMLTLFASQPYSRDGDLQQASTLQETHLTNTCLQPGHAKGNSVVRFWDLPVGKGLLHHDWKDQALQQIEAATAALFEAAVREQMVHFQALPNAFEVFGIDWLVDERGNV